MGEIDRVRSKNWDNAVPLRLSLAADNITTSSRPQPLYILAPRQSYLCTVATRAWSQFQHVLPNLPGQHHGLRPWFDHKQLPLRGDLPIGVLYDLFAARQGASDDLPWELTIHYTGHPESQHSWSNGLPMHSLFFHSLKEACFICKGPDGAAAIMKMNGAAQDALWAAVEKSEAQRYHEVLAGLRVAPTSKQGAVPTVPLRLLVPASQGSLLATWDDAFMTSRPAPASLPDGSWTTLRHLLGSVLPQLHFVGPAVPGGGSSDPDPAAVSPSASVAVSEEGRAPSAGLADPAAAEAGSSGGGVHEADPAAASSQSHMEASSHAAVLGQSVLIQSASKHSASGAVAGLEPGRECQALVCGIVPPLETPIAWLHAHMHAPDYFLYVVVRPAEAEGCSARGGPGR